MILCKGPSLSTSISSDSFSLSSSSAKAVSIANYLSRLTLVNPLTSRIVSSSNLIIYAVVNLAPLYALIDPFGLTFIFFLSLLAPLKMWTNARTYGPRVGKVDSSLILEARSIDSGSTVSIE